MSPTAESGAEHQVGSGDPTRNWREHAACAGMGVDLFFHPTFERGFTRARRFAEARAVCARCPVTSQCREFALQVGERYGTWGGLDELERRRLLRTPQPTT